MNENQAKTQNAYANPIQADELSLFQLIRQDYIAFVGAVVPPVIWGILIYIAILKGQVLSNNLLLVGGFVTLVSLGILAWRVLFFRSLFSDAQEAQAVICGIYFSRDFGRANFTFTYNGQNVRAGSVVMKTKRTRALNTGDEVLVLVDRNNPQKAIIRKLYSRAG